ncbi:MAG: hypothetical protein EA418_03735 [Wenzhouxiangellaceae bacterium]|nr:MAG: hypothetical protein EA418_03735 [Wenzhouxiangellaceae bacterium]
MADCRVELAGLGQINGQVAQDQGQVCSQLIRFGKGLGLVNILKRRHLITAAKVQRCGQNQQLEALFRIIDRHGQLVDLEGHGAGLIILALVVVGPGLAAQQ